MKTLKSLFMLCAGLSFCACSSDNEPQFPEGTGAVTVKIVPPQTRADDASATADEQVVNGDIKLILTHNSGVTEERTITYSDGSYTGTNVTKDGDELAVVFYNVVNPTKLTASMNGGVVSYDAVSIVETEPAMQATPESIPVYGETATFVKSGSVINDGNKDYVEYTASIQLQIPVARLEIQVGVGNSFDGFSSVSLAGAYLDKVKPTDAGAVTDYYLQYDNSQTKKADGTDEDAYAILCDNYMTAEATLGNEAKVLHGTGAVSVLPAENKYYAYNFYAGTNPEFKLCLKVVGSDAQNPIPGIQYAIVNEFLDSSSAAVTFEAGKIYRVTNLTLNGTNIQVDESGAELQYALTATVEQAKWTVVTNVNGSWAQGN